jgi:hypothetical protein
MTRRGVVLDPYVIDTLMRDLVCHDRSAASFLVFLHLWSETNAGTQHVATSYQSIATSIGLSKRSVQNGVARLAERRLVTVRRAYATAVPEYRVRRPWTRGPSG